MIRPAALLLPAAGLARIVAAAERAWPEECCGLLVGRSTRLASGGEAIEVTEAVESANVATPPRHRRFEVDPALRFALMRRLRGTGERIVGHYHSHPDAPALPSRRDADAGFEADLVWLIIAVAGGIAAGEAAAFLPGPAGDGSLPGDGTWNGFSRLAVTVTG